MKFIAPFSGVKAGEIYPTHFQPGDHCPPELEAAALAAGAVKPAPAAKKPAKVAEE